MKMKLIGKRIRDARAKNELTQAALARLVGVNAQTVWRWESGERVPDLSTIQEIAIALQTTTAYLIGDIDWSHRPGEFEVGDGGDILPGHITPEMKRKRGELINRIKDPDRERTWLPAEESEDNATRQNSTLETAASAALHDKNQPDDLLSMLTQVRLKMTSEYPGMDANDKNAVMSILAKINTLVDDTAEGNEEIA